MSGVGSTEPPRSGGAGSAGAGADTVDPELARKNTLLGWALLAVMVALFAGTVVVALIYLAVD